jgi:hypothetical protein
MRYVRIASSAAAFELCEHSRLPAVGYTRQQQAPVIPLTPPKDGSNMPVERFEQSDEPLLKWLF